MIASTLFGFGHQGLEFLAMVAIQIAVVCAIAGMLALRRPAATRSRIWIGALLGCIVGPVLLGAFQLGGTRLLAVESPFATARATTPIQHSTPDSSPLSEPERPTRSAAALPVMPHPVGLLPSEVPSGVPRDVQPEAQPVDAPRDPIQAPSNSGLAWPPAADIAWWGWLATWLMGSILITAKIRRSSRAVRHLRASSTGVDTRSIAHVLTAVQRAVGTTNLPEICHSPLAPQPMTLGGGAPMVVLPSDLLETLSPYQLRDILIHECGHVVQHDLRLGWLQAAAHAIFWWHPAVHITNRELGIAREELCDNRVLEVAAPASYARTLLELCERQQLQMSPLSCGLLPRRWPLRARVAGLLDGRRSTGLTMGRMSGIATLAGLLGVSATIAGTGFQPRQDPVRSRSTAEVKEQQGENSTAESVRGVFTDASGSPVANAQVALVSSDIDGYLAPRGQTQADGSFEFEVQDRPEEFFRYARVTLRKPGIPLAWGKLRDFRDGGRTIAAAESHPLHGRILDLEGRPVQGVTVQVMVLYGSPVGSLDDWLETLRKPNVGLVENTYEYLTEELRLRGLPQPLAAHTDAEGRFSFPDLGAERLAHVQVYGAGIASQELHLLSSNREPFQQSLSGMGPEWGIAQVYGDSFEHHVAPSRVIQGTVRNGATGQPLVGAQVRSERVSPGRQLGWIKTVTDDKGEYRLVGMPKGDGNTIKVTPKAGDPCFAEEFAVPNPDGMDPVALHVELDQGIVIAGRVIDEATGEGVSAQIREFRKGEFSDQSVTMTRGDGSFQVVTTQGTLFLTASVRKDSSAYEAVANRKDVSAWDDELGDSMFPTLGGWHGAERIIVEEQVGPREPVTILVKRGIPRTLRFVDEQGAPITGALVLYANAGGRPAPTPTDSWTLSAAAATRTYGLVVQQLDRGVGALALVSEELPPESTVVLKPWATVKGRLVDTLGKPRAGVRLVLSGLPPSGNGVCFFDAATKAAMHTNDDGTFLVEGLVQGLEYELKLQEGGGIDRMMESDDVVFEGLTVTFGERRQLGDVKASKAAR